ncbi:cilia- and flagella-associated protein 144-like [Saccoglossus kowalevskii]|uniref:Protein FAM183B-like n=1 Tax=Saccoglossus kowalevskii TaxID=10224 RepID=A0ABM0GTR5_SACKO|nr:PREDICTED: protein FAM183B-like [Saccoglossus kowalevskii]
MSKGATAAKDPINIVHQSAILEETIKKEQRHQKLYTTYSVNPFRKMYTLTGKPNSTHDSADGEEDDNFLKIIHRAHQEPVKKYTFPQTEAQEIGWMSKPLIPQDREDRRLHFPRQNSEITKYMDAAWRMKEQQENLQ